MVSLKIFFKVEYAKNGLQLSCGKIVGGILSAYDFVDVGDSNKSSLDVIHTCSYNSKWCLRANATKSEIMVFLRYSKWLLEA